MDRAFLGRVLKRPELLVIEWSAIGLKIIHLKKIRWKWKMVQCLSRKWPDGFNIPHPEVRPIDYIPCLKKIINEEKLNGLPVSLILPRSEFFLRWIISSEDEKKQAQKILPLPLEGLFLRSYVFGKRKLVLALPKNRYEAFDTTLKSCGLKLNGIGPNFIYHLQVLTKINAPQKTIAFADVGSFQGQFTVIRHGEPLYCHSFESDRRKSILKIEEEILSSLQNFQIKYPCESIDLIYLMGANSLPHDLIERLQSRLKIRVNEIRLKEWKGWAGPIGQTMVHKNGDDMLIKSRPVKIFEKKIQFILLGGFVLFTTLTISLTLKLHRQEIVITRLKMRAHENNAPAKKDYALHILKNVMTRLPKKTRLSMIQWDGEQKILHVRGLTTSFDNVSLLVQSWLKTPMLKKVIPEQSKLVQRGKQRGVQFSIKGYLK